MSHNITSRDLDKMTKSGEIIYNVDHNIGKKYLTKAILDRVKELMDLFPDMYLRKLNMEFRYSPNVLHIEVVLDSVNASSRKRVVLSYDIPSGMIDD